MLNHFCNESKFSEIRLEVFGDSEVGHKRTTNEDAFLIANVDPSQKLLAVADAFGGGTGENTGRLAVNELRELMLRPSRRHTRQRLCAAFEIIDQDLERHFRNIRHTPPAGTTLTAIYVDGATAYLAHVGNSRAYLIREGKLFLLTKDHTFAQVLIESGVEPSASSRKTLLQALGANCKLEPAVIEVELLSDDHLLLCSDGFSDKLHGPDLVRTIEDNASVEAAVERLIRSADERDGGDNITVILARVCRAAAAWMKVPMQLKPAI